MLIDPDQVLLKTLHHEKDATEWIRQLEGGPRAINRIDAADALGQGESRAAAVAALGQALASDLFHGVRRAAARALGRIGTGEARDHLARNAGQRDSRVRGAVLKALGDFAGEKDAAEMLRVAIQRERADAPHAAALEALAKVLGKEAFDDLNAALARPSHREVVRAAALKGLARVGSDEALETVLAWTEWGRPQRARIAATEALGGWPDARRRVTERLIDLTRDEWLFVRQEAARALGKLEVDEAVPALERLAEHDLHSRVRLAARRSLQRLRQGTGAGPDNIHGELERLRKETRRLRNEIEALRKDGAAGHPSP